MPTFSIKIDKREFDRSIRALLAQSDIKPHVLVNRKGYRVFQKAVWHAPVTSAEKIQRELQAGAAAELVKLKSGRFSKNKKNIKNFFGGAGGGVPLLALIIQSRHEGTLHGHPSPWKGVNRATGARLMLEAMRRVYGARQKSRAYFKACFATIRDIFKQAHTGSLPLSDPGSRGSGTKSSLARDRGRIADARPATGGSKAAATFWLVSPRSDISGGIYRHAQPALQQAFDEESEEIWKRTLELEIKAACKTSGIKTR